MSNNTRRTRLLALFASFFLIAVAAYGLLLAQGRTAYNESFTHQFVAFEIGNNYAGTSAHFNELPPYTITVGYSSNKKGIGKFYRSAWARWRLNLYPLLSFTHTPMGSKAFLIIESDIPHADVKGASVSFLLNGDTLHTLRLSQSVNNQYQSSDADRDRAMQLVHYAPADVRTAWAFPIPTTLLQQKVRPDVEVVTNGFAAIPVRSVGVMLQYTPAVSPIFVHPSRTLWEGIIVLVLLSLGVAFVADRVFTIGGFPALLIMVFLFVLALLNQDQWDFPIWRRLSELVTFGNANPALDWNLSPFWAFIPSAVSPIVATIALQFHAVGPGITGVFLKILFGIAYVYGAVLVAGFAQNQRRVLYAMLASIFGAYLLMWGARDIFAIAFVFAAFALAWRGHLWPAQILLLMGASVEEYLLPLMLVPALAEVASGRGSLLNRIAKGASLVLIGFGGFAAQWLLVSRVHFSESLTFRLHYHYLEATWQHVFLQMFGETNPISATLLIHKTFVSISIYATLSIGLIVCNLRTLFARCESARDYLRSNLPVFSALLGVFFLSYGQVDQQEWFGFIAIVALTAAVTGSCSTFAYFWMFSAVAGIELYAHYGLREFLNPAILQSADFGLITIRGPIDTNLILCVILLILGYVVHVFSRARIALTSDATFYCFTAWIIAVWTSVDFFFAPDLAIAIAASATLVLYSWCMLGQPNIDGLLHRFRFFTRTSAMPITVAAAIFTGNPVLAFIAALFVVALNGRRPSIVDVVLLFSAMSLAVQARGAIAWYCVAVFLVGFAATAIAALRSAPSRIRHA